MPISDITTVADIVRVHGRERPEDIALVSGQREMTWAELNRRAQQVANGLVALGVGQQDRVAFLDKNGLEHFELFFGASLINAVCVDVNWRLAPREVAFIVGDAGARVFVVGAEFVPLLDDIAGELAGVDTILVIGDHERYERWDDWVSRQAVGDQAVHASPDDVAMQLYSSGTTGRPKGVMLTHHNFFGLLPAARDIWELDATARNLVAMPLFHIGGGGWALAGMYEGCTSIVLRDLHPSELVHLVGQQRITHAFLVPAVLQFMLMVPGVEAADFSSLQVIVYGASPISEAVLARSVEVFGCKFWQAYGLTETTGAVVHLPPHDHDPAGPRPYRLRSCGLPGPAVEVRIVDPESQQDLAVNDVGEILIRSPQVMKGYWNQPDATAQAINEAGWFRSGDLGYLDADGYLYIHDRVKDMIVSGGENVYPAEVENVLMAHPGVADAAVIGVPHDRWGESPKALVVRAEGAEVTEHDLIEFCRAHLAKFKCPTSVEWLEVLPRNPSGKVLKKDLRAPYWAGRERHVN
jgi:long-chain acyl-CoA synthetase